MRQIREGEKEVWISFGISVRVKEIREDNIQGALVSGYWVIGFRLGYGLYRESIMGLGL